MSSDNKTPPAPTPAPSAPAPTPAPMAQASETTTATVAVATSQQYVTFWVGEDLFAFPMASVREIIRMPELVRVPMTPATLAGVANLRGQVLPILSLRRTFRLEDRAVDDGTRVIVVDEGALVGFIVDRVASVITVEPEQIEGVESIEAAIEAELLAGLLKDVANQPMVMCLDVTRLVGAGTRGLSKSLVSSTRASRAADDKRDGEAVSDERQLVSFMVSGQEYAFPIERVQEIVQIPERISSVPKSSAHVLGVMTLRNRLLPLVSMRRMFHMESDGASAGQRIVVIGVAGRDRTTDSMVGIVVDAVNEVLRVPERLVDSLPSVLAEQQPDGEIDAICRLEDGNRLVSILSVERLFHTRAMRDALTQTGAASTERATGSGRELAREHEEQLVVFRLQGQEYGVPIDSVREIVRPPDTMTRVPKGPACLAGVVNLRGQILPVVDFRSRFGLQAAARDERQRIVVLSLSGQPTGFIVDSVAEVLKVASSSIEDVPQLSEEQAHLMGRVANLHASSRMIMILAPEHLLDGGDLEALGRVRNKAAAAAA